MNDEQNKQGYKSVSLFKKRLQRFKSIKRGYYSFIIVVALYIISFFCPLLMNFRPLVVSYNGSLYFPIFKLHQSSEFGQEGYGEANYRELKKQFQTDGQGNWLMMPPYPYGPLEGMSDAAGDPLQSPSWEHWFGTDDRGRDVFVRLAYGFNISLSFSLLLVIVNYFVGISVGASLGYFSGKLDIFGQRVIEMWTAIPILYLVMIISSIIRPNFILLVFLLCLHGWVGITFYMRGEFYREKAKDYVHAAISMGCSDKQVIFKHILPNALTPVIAFAPFAVVGGVGSLVSLDYLGFGLPPPTPSWGELVGQGMANIMSWWLVVFPFGALFCTLLLVVFIGEAVRQAFDPRVFSRLR